MTRAEQALRILQVFERAGHAITFGPLDGGRWFARLAAAEESCKGEDLIDALGQLATVLGLE